MTNRIERRSNIELLRIITMLGVIILHYNNANIGGALLHVQKNSFNMFILYWIESMFVCAVNVFIIISGYFMCTSQKRTLKKPIQLLAQVIVFSEAVYIVSSLISKNISLTGFISRMIPVNYFVILYIALYFISPYINFIISNLDMKQLKRMIIIMVSIFSIYPTLVDLSEEILGREWVGLSTIGAYGSQWGYTIINFSLMYIIGGYLRKRKNNNSSISQRKIIIYYIACTIIICVWQYGNDFMTVFNEKSALSYCNPIVIVNAMLIFLFFESLQIKNNKIINCLSKESFSVFLLMNIFLTKCNIEVFVNSNPVIMILHIILTTIVIYLLCWAIGWIYKSITTTFFKKSEKLYLLNKDIIY